MTHHKETTVDYNPTAYELGRMFYNAGRGYNPYILGTPFSHEFIRGKRDADKDNAKRNQDKSITPQCSSDRLKQDAELRRNQFHQ
jgi:hypothetical protein